MSDQEKLKYLYEKVKEAIREWHRHLDRMNKIPVRRENKE